jgi:hypothetical protein
MTKKFAIFAAFLLLAGCQTDVPQSVADSQVPPSPAVRNELVRILKKGGGKIGNFINPQISSVVLLDPATKTYAFCVRAWPASYDSYPDVIGISFSENRLVGSTKNDYRCRDKRLRYYPYPELKPLRG